jgi:hypothetical protein
VRKQALPMHNALLYGGMLVRQRRKTAFTVPLLALFAVACVREAREEVGASEGALLPNPKIFEVDHDGATYRLIAEYFKGRDLDTHVVLEGFDPAWPLADTKTAVLNRVGTPVLFAQLGYFHTGFDVIRSDSTVGMDVRAPHDGLAAVFDWTGARISNVTNPQTTVVAIYDPVSHVITQLMHVRPTDAIAQAADPIPVTKGEVIGKLAPAPVGTQEALRLAHVHLNFIDGENMKILNPAKLFAGYKDTVAPEVKGVYVAGETGIATSEFYTGKLDVIVETADRDDDSRRNLEIAAIAFQIKDQDGRVLASQDRCDLAQLYESIARPAPFRAKHLIDFGSAAEQVRGGWPSSDVDNPARTFRYALTQLLVEDGRCTVKDDEQGFLDVSDEVTKLVVEVTLWDAKGNETVAPPVTIERGAPPNPVGSATDDSDDGWW